MTKINKGEYEILKALDDYWKWIARDENGRLWGYNKKPFNNGDEWLELNATELETYLFQFIQWEDEEPYNIAELIEEYEREHKHNILDDFFNSRLSGQRNYKEEEESEETEVKKDLDWLVQRVHTEREQLAQSFSEGKETDDESAFNDGKDEALSSVLRLINQLDEPETLSEEWIDKRKVPIFWMAEEQDAVRVEHLQNLLVPKQEEVDRAYKDGYEKGKQHTFYKGYLEGLADKEKEPETVADVVSTFWKSFERLKEVMSMEVEELEE